jgi:SAM-dependent methyltransferase
MTTKHSLAKGAAMTTTTPAKGTAERWGALWGARAEDWAANEDQHGPTYMDAIREAGIGPGQRVLDIGCGSGVFLQLAAERGTEVYGLDASEALIALARKRVPQADFRVGEMLALPYEDNFFDVVTGFNSFFFAADMVAALREARRVAKPGSHVVIQVWGRPERCQLEAMKHALAPHMPPPDPDAPRGSDLWQPGRLDDLAAQAGLAPVRTYVSTWAYEYPDDDAVARGMLSAGGLALIAEQIGGGEVERAIVEAFAPYRTESGGYRLENDWLSLLATA